MSCRFLSIFAERSGKYLRTYNVSRDLVFNRQNDANRIVLCHGTLVGLVLSERMVESANF